MPQNRASSARKMYSQIADDIYLRRRGCTYENLFDMLEESDLPRACGDAPNFVFLSIEWYLFAPRLRGCPLYVKLNAFFPACAGVYLSAQNAIMQSTFTSCLRVAFRDLGKWASYGFLSKRENSVYAEMFQTIFLNYLATLRLRGMFSCLTAWSSKKQLGCRRFISVWECAGRRRRCLIVPVCAGMYLGKPTSYDLSDIISSHEERCTMVRPDGFPIAFIPLRERGCLGHNLAACSGKAKKTNGHPFWDAGSMILYCSPA